MVPINKTLWIPAIVLIGLGLAVGGCTVTRTRAGMAESRTIDRMFSDKLTLPKGHLKPSLHLIVGEFENLTGQNKEEDRQRYSSALSQGTKDLLNHVLFMAFGPRVVLDRETENYRRAIEEYEMSHLLDENGRRVGMIQRGGPEGGVTGCDLMIAGAVISYNTDRQGGGGGANVDSVGGSFEYSTTEVSLELRLVDLNTSQVVWTRQYTGRVKGYKVNADVFRFVIIGGDEYLVSAEAGIAWQVPAYFAMQDCLVRGVSDMVNDRMPLFMVTGVTN